MRITDIFSSRAVATRETEAASNRIPYFGEGLFPARKKLGLDLKWIKGHKGLPVSLAPSNFDAKSTLRGRQGFSVTREEMPFFRESVLVKEEDEQNIMRVQESDDPYAMEILQNIYDDTDTLVEGARVVPERMRMQLLAPADGSPGIFIEHKGVTYKYNYDTDGSYKANNYMAITTDADKWSNADTSDPMADVSAGQDAVEERTGTRPTVMLISKKTMGYLKKNKKIQSAVLAQNVTANVLMNDARVKELFNTELGVSIVVCTKKYKDESGTAHAFYPDDMATLLPAGTLGNTWYGTTPEERAGGSGADVSIVDTGIAVMVVENVDPVNTETIASEIVLPSYERMDETYVIKVA